MGNSAIGNRGAWTDHAPVGGQPARRPPTGQNEPVVTADVGELARARRAGDLDTAAGDTGERITENTLIRLAIDLLIAKAGQLHGSTEGKLRRSLGLGD